MNDLPKNQGAFLVGLGMQPRPTRTGLASPPVIHQHDVAPPSAMIETKTEVDAYIDNARQVGGRAFPARSPYGSRTV